jgi:hypothetical protein
VNPALSFSDLATRASSFVVAEDGTQTVRIERRGGLKDDVWAITRGREVMNARGGWEFEPQPSSRSQAFLARTRFTLRGALALCNEQELWDRASA